MTFFTMFCVLLSAHALCDYPLQGEFLAKAKNHKFPIPGIPFYHALLSHAAIHGGAVGLITGSLWLGMAEFVAHAVIDSAKCAGWTDLDTDQILHIACKALWVGLVILHPAIVTVS